MAETGDSTLASISSTNAGAPKSSKSHELATMTIKAPSFSYAHLELLQNSAECGDLDALQVKSYCTAALKQFLGISGTAISVEILKVDGSNCWLRVPRDDLSAFAAAMTAWQGTFEDGVHSTLRLKGCSDWLGTLVGRDGEDQLWR